MKHNFNNKSKLDNIENINSFTNNIISKITKNLENFHYNVIIANMHETYNYLSKSINNLNERENFMNNYTNILKILSPIVPHLAEECLQELKVTDKNIWPKVEQKYLKKIFSI